MNVISKNRIHSPEHRIWFLSMDGLVGHALKAVELVRMGIVDTTRPYQTRRCHEPGYHLLFYIVEGQYEIWCQNKHVQADPNTLLLVPMHQIRQIRLISQKGTHVFVHPRPTRTWQATFESGFAVLQRQDTQNIARHLRELLAARLSTQPDAAELIQLYAQLLRVYLLRERQCILSPTDHVLTRRLDALWQQVNDEIDGKWTIARMARYVGVSQAHFQDICKRLMHTSPGQYLAGLRMEKAQSLLSETDATIASVAQAVGYSSEYSFSRLFLKHTGIRPGAYQKQLSTA